MQIIRCATTADTEQVRQMADTVSELMTTMPRTERAIHKRFQHCQDSLRSINPLKQPKTYFFVMEEDKKIVGTSAIYANIGSDKPFYSYKVVRRSQLSPELEYRVDYKVLQPSNDFSGTAEVGTLYLPPQWRSGGRGKLLSIARFLFIVAHRERFRERVFAETRGWTDDNNQSPFWEAVGQKFYGMSLQEADLLSGNNHRFIADLIPPYPIYVDLLPQAAQDVVGITNDGSKPAATMLKKLGFRNHNYVNILDAGLCISKYIDDVNLVRDASKLPCTIATSPFQGGSDAFLSNTDLKGFVAIRANAHISSETITLSKESAKALSVEQGDTIIVYSGKDPNG